MYVSKLRPLYTAFLQDIKLSGYRIGIQLDNSVLTIEQNNYNLDVYDLDAWPRIPLTI